jgi:hypothetical protein
LFRVYPFSNRECPRMGRSVLKTPHNGKDFSLPHQQRGKNRHQIGKLTFRNNES